MISQDKLGVSDLLMAYQSGYFPMAEPDGTIYWYLPEPRAIIPLEQYQAARSLRPILNRGRFEIRINQRFREVMQACAEPRRDQEETWISEELIDLYTKAHELGYAHSVESYLDGVMVGGLYGISLGGVFFGESMFSSVSNASKVAFHGLVQILKHGNYDLLDSQIINPHTQSLGAIEISNQEYLQRLHRALGKKCVFELP